MTSPNRSVSDFIKGIPHIQVSCPQILSYIVRPGLCLSSPASCSLHISVQSCGSLFVVHSCHMPEPPEPSFPDHVHHCLPLSQLLSGNLISDLVSPTSVQYSSQPAHLRHQQSPLILSA